LVQKCIAEIFSTQLECLFITYWYTERTKKRSRAHLSITSCKYYNKSQVLRPSGPYFININFILVIIFILAQHRVTIYKYFVIYILECLYNIMSTRKNFFLWFFFRRLFIINYINTCGYIIVKRHVQTFCVCGVYWTERRIGKPVTFWSRKNYFYLFLSTTYKPFYHFQVVIL